MSCEFSLVHYREILAFVAEHYESLPFSHRERSRGARPRIFMRHDLDHSLALAVQMARIEADAGVRATYFVQLHADSYCATSLGQVARVRELMDLGHEVGLHYDTGYYARYAKDVRRAFQRDLEMLSDVAGAPIVSVSRHNPLDSASLGEISDLARFDAYSSAFTKDLKYISDSVMSWREGCVCGFLPKKIDLQVLVHPLWWCSDGTTMRDRIASCARAEAGELEREIERLAAYYQSCLDQRPLLDARLRQKGG
jgi:hypothetical protein